MDARLAGGWGVQPKVWCNLEKLHAVRLGPSFQSLPCVTRLHERGCAALQTCGCPLLRLRSDAALQPLGLRGRHGARSRGRGGGEARGGRSAELALIGVRPAQGDKASPSQTANQLLSPASTASHVIRRTVPTVICARVTRRHARGGDDHNLGRRHRDRHGRTGDRGRERRRPPKVWVSLEAALPT